MDNIYSLDLVSLLLQRCMHHDQKAFAHLYHLTAPKFFALAVHIVGREDWAVEVLQKSFITIWNQAGDYQATKDTPMAWMTSIVRRCALDVLQRTPCENRADEVVVQPSGVENSFKLASPWLSAWDDCIRRSSLEKLPDQSRQSILLVYFYGFTPQEIAQYMGVPLRMVKRGIRQGLDIMKRHLDSESPVAGKSETSYVGGKKDDE